MLRRVLVTGANSGIGLETALHLAGLGFRVVGTVRSEEKAESLAKAATNAGVDVDTAVLDVADARACARLIPTLDLWGLINNAGYMNVGRIDDVPIEDAQRQLEVMVVAPVRLATLALPAMRRRGEGRIVNISSVAAHVTAAMTGWYGACKHALTALSDSLRRELADDGIDVVLIEPGGLKTGIWNKAKDDLIRRRPGSVAPKAYDGALAVAHRARPVMGEPIAAARVIGDALTAGRPRWRYRVGADAPVLQLAHWLTPERVQDRLARTAVSE